MDRDSRLVERTLKSFRTRVELPDGVFDFGGTNLVTRGDATERYRAALEWFDEREHMVISNGPFLLSRYDPPAQFAELSAFREPNYPFRPGDWSYGEPPTLVIEAIDKVTLAAGGATEIEVVVNGPGSLGVRFLLIDPVEGEIVVQGEATLQGSRFVVELPANATRDLFPGFYELALVAYSDSIATVTDRSVDIDIE